METLAAAHDAGVQMIDTSVVRVHQHGACITRSRRQSMGRSRGGLTSKIPAVLDANGLPLRMLGICMFYACVAVLLPPCAGRNRPSKTHNMFAKKFASG
jgi:hypothetical protein